MDDSGKRILDASGQVIEKLRLLSVFFEDEVVYRILVRTQVIHRLFETNAELDVNKLALFHVQFTESIIELLKKIRKNNEKVVVSMEEEQEINTTHIDGLTAALRSEENFDYSCRAQAEAVSRTINRLYQNLSDYSVDNPFRKDITAFGARFAATDFFEVPALLIEELTTYDPEAVYRNGYGLIGKKLLGHQCRHDFRNRFHCGLRAGDDWVEIYKMEDEEHWFVFHPKRHLFVDCTPEQVAALPQPHETSKKARIVQELIEKNNTLKTAMVDARTAIPPEVAALLQEYLDKISAIDFLDLIDDYDIQANILKTMLNTEGL